MVKRTERGWNQYLIGSQWCSFKRNTLLEYEGTKVVVATTGNFMNPLTYKIDKIPGTNVWYATIVGMGVEADGYVELDGSKQIPVVSKHDIEAEKYEANFDLEANEMHEEVVEEVIKKLLDGSIKEEIK